MNTEHVDVCILGAGIAGLGAALRARELYRDAIIYEASDRTGGLLDNFTINGFRFDNAVHLSFATEPKVREIFDRSSFLTHPADSYCFENDRWLKHPVQNNLSALPAEQRVSLIKSFLSRPSDIAIDNYESWLRHQYGDEIAERYPIRYTKKYWDTPSAALSTNWIGNRMRRAELDEILLGAMTDNTPNTYYTKEMRYPKQGGYKSFITPLITDSIIRTGYRACAIDAKAKTVTFTNGKIVYYQKLISSMPLPLLAQSVKDAPQEIVDAAAQLKATSIDLISVGLNKLLVKDLWFYIYDENILASRAYSPSIKSPDNAPAGCSSLQFEVYSRGEKSRFDSETLKANTREALIKMNIAGPDDVIFMDHRFIKFGNVIFDRGMEKHRKCILDWANNLSIASCGRFGQWDYLWSNQSLLSGYNTL